MSGEDVRLWISSDEMNNWEKKAAVFGTEDVVRNARNIINSSPTFMLTKPAQF